MSNDTKNQTNQINNNDKDNLLHFPVRLTKKTLNMLRQNRLNNSSETSPDVSTTNSSSLDEFNLNFYKKYLETLTDEDLINESNHISTKLDLTSENETESLLIEKKISNTNITNYKIDNDQAILMANLILEELSKRIVK
ncbi:MAG: hypothetical protein HQK51_13580 [Oligoflexia bacterium]|nr:hypothetical protein [Oligoflexia bacterium]